MDVSLMGQAIEDLVAAPGDDAAVYTFVGLVKALPAEERGMWADLFDRLCLGFETYGALDLEADSRDFEEEAEFEAFDLMVYATLARRRRRLRREREARPLRVVGR